MITKTNYNISNNLNKKIVLISDIHYKNKKDYKRLNKVFESIKNINPDFICISGDLTDKSNIKDEKYLLLWLNNLKDITKTIISIGNHEFYNKNKIIKLNDKLLNKINNIDNIYLLNNSIVEIDNINFYGLTPSIKNNKCIVDITNIKTNKNKYNILLSHVPVINQNKFDLVLSGHMHGGVVLKIFRPIFKNNGLISPNKKLFPKNVYGKINNTIISSGLKVTPIKFVNIFFPMEIVIINI